MAIPEWGAHEGDAGDILSVGILRLSIQLSVTPPPALATQVFSSEIPTIWAPTIHQMQESRLRITECKSGRIGCSEVRGQRAGFSLTPALNKGLFRDAGDAVANV